MRKWLLSPLVAVLLTGGLAGQDDDGPAPLDIKVEDAKTLRRGSFAEFTVKEGLIAGDKVGWEVFPEPVRAKRYGSVLVVDGEEGVAYTVKVEIINFKKATWKKGSVQYVFGGTAVVPPPKEKEPNPTKPKDPETPDRPVAYYFAVVRPDGPASPDFTKVMQDPGWTVLRSKGHSVKDFTLTEAKALRIDPEAVPLPAVVTLEVRNGKSFVAVPPRPLPRDPALIPLLSELK